MSKSIYLLLGVLPLVVSCASTTVISDVVGPGPFVAKGASPETGYLRVYSQREKITEGFGYGANPRFYQHTAYRVYNEQGKLVHYVGNTIGEYDSSPSRIALRPGRYIVKASAKDYLTVQIPVLVEPGFTTNVHLDDRWQPPSTADRGELVSEPNGQPVGWRAPAARQLPDSQG